MTQIHDFREIQRVFPEFWDLAAERIRMGVMSLADMARTLPADSKTIRKDMRKMGFNEIGYPRRAVMYRLQDARIYALWLAHPKPIERWPSD